MEYRFHCPVEATLSIIGGKYKAIILHHLIEGKLRFSELQKLLPQASPKMLSQQLKELREDNAIERTVYPVVPPKTEYELTAYGKTLIPVVGSLCSWGREHLSAHIKPESST